MTRAIACLTLLAAALGASAQPVELKPGMPLNSSIQYKSVSEAMQALRKRGDVKFEEEKSGWVLALEPDNVTSWMFVPRNHLAYPAVVKRTLVRLGDEYNVLMSILCEGRTRACGELTEEFNRRNEKLRQEIAREREKRK